MKYRDNIRGSRCLAEDDEIWEMPKKRPARFVRRGKELLWVRGDPLHRGPQCFTKSRHDLRGVRFVPAQRVVKIGPRGGRE